MTTIKQLTDEAKRRGLRGYYKLNKAELQRLLANILLDEPVPDINVPVLTPEPPSSYFQRVKNMQLEKETW